MFTGDTFGFFFLALVGFIIGGILYLSERRAPTEERKYIYSPTYSRAKRTPKLAFVAVACTLGLGMAALGFLSYLHPSPAYGRSTISVQAMRVLDPLAHIFAGLTVILIVGAVVLLKSTTGPAGQRRHGKRRYGNRKSPAKIRRDAEE
jgi:hypothetical protein